MLYFETFVLIMLSRLLGLNSQRNSMKVQASNQYDKMNDLDKHKVIEFCQELVRDITLKVRQTDVIFQEYGNDFIFELGFILGQIREKHKLQMEYYRQALNKYQRKARLFPPEYLLEKNRNVRSVHYFIMMEHVHRKELEIDTLVETVIRIPKNVLDQYPAQPNLAVPVPASAESNATTASIMPKHIDNPPSDPPPSAAPQPTTPPPPLDDQAVPKMRAPKDTRDSKLQKSMSQLEAELKRKNRAHFLLRHGKKMFTRS